MSRTSWTKIMDFLRDILKDLKTKDRDFFWTTKNSKCLEGPPDQKDGFLKKNFSSIFWTTVKELGKSCWQDSYSILKTFFWTKIVDYLKKSKTLSTKNGGFKKKSKTLPTKNGGFYKKIFKTFSKKMYFKRKYSK